MKKTIALAMLLGFATVGLVLANSQPDVSAAPTPIPGGANQLRGVSGGLSSTLFNGKIRIWKMALRASTAAEYTPANGQRGIVLSWLVSNGTSSERTGYFASSLADADGVVIDGKAVTIYSAFYTLQPGAAARQTMQFIVPADYTPTKILLVDQGSPAGPAFRVNLKTSDIPSPTAP